MVTALQSTHLSDAVHNLTENNVGDLRYKLAEKLNNDLTEVQNESESHMWMFINFIRQKYMIENIFLILLNAV